MTKPLWEMTLLTAVLAAAAAGLAPGHRPAADAATAPTTAPAGRFAVATYNVLYKNRDLKELVETIRKAQADLVALQETNAASERALRRELSRLYPHMAFRHAPQAGGFALLSKSPLRNVTYVRPRHGYFGMLTARAMLGGKDVQVANVHLHPFNPRKGESPVAALLQSEKVREKEIAYFAKRLAPKGPVIVLGDFNTTSQMAAPKRLSSRGFIDSFASVTENSDRHATWRLQQPGMELGLRIDYIFHTADVRTVGSRVIPSKASDHDLVVSKLAWAKAGPGTATTTAAAGSEAR